MTIPTGTVPATPRRLDALDPEVPATPRRPGSYWDHEQARWTAYAPLPAPRPAAD
jgi:hypothetical protein